MAGPVGGGVVGAALLVVVYYFFVEKVSLIKAASTICLGGIIPLILYIPSLGSETSQGLYAFYISWQAAVFTSLQYTQEK